MFRAMISPIFRSTRLCVTACGIVHQRCYRPATSWVHYTTSCKHSLVLLKMGEIIARNMLSWLELLQTVIVSYSWLSILFLCIKVIEERSRNHCCPVEGIVITYSKCVFRYSCPSYPAWQCANAVLVTLPHFSTLSYKWHFFRKICIEHKMCVSIFSRNLVWNASRFKNNLARYYHKHI